MLEIHQDKVIERDIIRYFSQSAVKSYYGKGLTEINWKKENNPDDYVYFNKTYNGVNGNDQEGDGYKFRGAGYLHLTGRSNYQDFVNYLNDNGRRDDRIMNIGAEIIASDYAWESAMWYWKYKTDKNGLNGTELVEAGTTVTDITHFVNGGENGLNERQTAYDNFKWEE